VKGGRRYTSLQWVPPVREIPKRYASWAPDGLASWAGLMGFDPLSESLFFSFFFSSIFLFSNLDSI
jgi:hypothetical protein